MPYYRRNRSGRMFFFTIVCSGRRNLLHVEAFRKMLHDAYELTRSERPWRTEAIVLLPNHLHFMWRMPEGDTDYSTRIAVIKTQFTKAFLKNDGLELAVTQGQARHRRRGVWQERFWEHTIRDAKDFRMHLDYIHLNPVKHGLASRPKDRPWSSFQQHVKDGGYEEDWCGRSDLPENVEYYLPE